MEISRDESDAWFDRMVDSVGVKAFADQLGLSTRQVNRMLSGAQANPIRRLIRCMQACDPAVGDAALAYLCKEMGGHFVKDEPSVNDALVNAVKECAEAIAVLSDGQIGPGQEREVREAIAALLGVLHVAAPATES